MSQLTEQSLLKPEDRDSNPANDNFFLNFLQFTQTVAKMKKKTVLKNLFWSIYFLAFWRFQSRRRCVGEATQQSGLEPVVGPRTVVVVVDV